MSLQKTLLLSALGLTSLTAMASSEATSNAAKDYSPYATKTQATNVYWGDSHLHTGLSLDAGLFGNTLGPDDAYRFARGEAVKLPNGIVTQLSVPLDFTAVTDHAEGFDAIAACTYPDHPQYSSAACENMRKLMIFLTYL